MHGGGCQWDLAVGRQEQGEALERATFWLVLMDALETSGTGWSAGNDSWCVCDFAVDPSLQHEKKKVALA